MMKRTQHPKFALTLLATACLLGSSSLYAREGFFLFDDVEYEAPVATTPDGKVKFEVYGDTAVTEGDIIIGSARSLITGIGTRGLGRTGKVDRWIDGIVYYQFHDGVPQADRDRVLQAIEHWNETTSITLVPRTPAIEATVPDYVFFEPYPACASWVGRIGGGQTLNVGSQCSTGSLIHEIGHALGLFHEHTRADRDDYVTVVWENIKHGKEFNFDIVSDGVAPVDDYDYASIMHYGSTFFSSNGLQTIHPPDGVVIGQREGLSAIDRASINKLYATDLTLLSHSSAEASTNVVTVNLTVSNIGALGAHDIEFLMPLKPGQELVNSVQSDWACSSTPEYISCNLWRLSNAAHSQFSLQVSGTADTADIGNGYLRSKTFDQDTSNNGVAFELPPETTEKKAPEADSTGEPSPTEAQEPAVLAAADASPASSGGGSLDWWLGFGLLSFGLVRLRGRVQY